MTIAEAMDEFSIGFVLSSNGTKTYSPESPQDWLDALWALEIEGKIIVTGHSPANTPRRKFSAVQLAAFSVFQGEYDFHGVLRAPDGSTIYGVRVQRADVCGTEENISDMAAPQAEAPSAEDARLVVSTRKTGYEDFTIVDKWPRESKRKNHHQWWDALQHLILTIAVNPSETVRTSRPGFREQLTKAANSGHPPDSTTADNFIKNLPRLMARIASAQEEAPVNLAGAKLYCDIAIAEELLIRMLQKISLPRDVDVMAALILSCAETAGLKGHASDFNDLESVKPFIAANLQKLWKYCQPK